MPIYSVMVQEKRVYEVYYYVEADDAQSAANKAWAGETIREVEARNAPGGVPVEVLERHVFPQSVCEVDPLTVEARLALDSLEEDYPAYYADLARYTRLDAALTAYISGPTPPADAFEARELREAIAYANRRDVPAGDE